MGCFVALGDYLPAVGKTQERMQAEKIMKRIWARDHSVWKESPKEISNRLGWLRCPENMMGAIEDISAFADEVRGAGFTHALLLGMGGSSLAPWVFRRVFGVEAGYLDLAVLDSTDPGAVLEHARGLDPSRTLYIVSTKSGGTVETVSLMKYFFNRAVEALGEGRAPERFIAITDPGSGLESIAGELGFRRVFLNDPDIGGRYSALSYFGLVPAALMGMNLGLLLERAQRMAINTQAYNYCSPGGDNSAACLGAAVGELALAGRDKLTLLTSPALAPFGAWVEQLIAESTGKEGKGVLPVCGEEPLSPTEYADDRLFVSLTLRGADEGDFGLEELAGAGHPVVSIELSDLYDLGGEMFRWEMVTAVAGAVMGINPFDQPDVESAKAFARKMVAVYGERGVLPEPRPSVEEDGVRLYADFDADGVAGAVREFLSSGKWERDGSSERGYVALLAYLKPGRDVDRALGELRGAVRRRVRAAVTLGYGPRYLHSTGQLHKGDAGRGLFIIFTADNALDAPIPELPGSAHPPSTMMSFGVLERAQALGDREALMAAGRRVLWIDLGSDVEGKLKMLTEVLK